MTDAAGTATAATAAMTGENPDVVQQGGAGNEKQEDSRDGNLDTLIQKAVDRATNKLGNENKKLRGEIESLKKASMDADELKNLELSEKEKEIAEREKALNDRENRLTAIKAIKEAGLDDGSDAALAIVDFVMAEDEERIRSRVKAFDALVKKLVTAQVDAVFKANGRTPGASADTQGNAGGKNESVAVRLGKSAAAANQKSRAILDSYLGGR